MILAKKIPNLIGNCSAGSHPAWSRNVWWPQASSTLLSKITALQGQPFKLFLSRPLGSKSQWIIYSPRMQQRSLYKLGLCLLRVMHLYVVGLEYLCYSNIRPSYRIHRPQTPLPSFQTLYTSLNFTSVINITNCTAHWLNGIYQVS